MGYFLLLWLLIVEVWTLIFIVEYVVNMKKVSHLFFDCTYARKVWSFVLPSDSHVIIVAAQGGNW